MFFGRILFHLFNASQVQTNKLSFVGVWDIDFQTKASAFSTKFTGGLEGSLFAPLEMTTDPSYCFLRPRLSYLNWEFS